MAWHVGAARPHRLESRDLLPRIGLAVGQHPGRVENPALPYEAVDQMLGKAAQAELRVLRLLHGTPSVYERAAPKRTLVLPLDGSRHT